MTSGGHFFLGPLLIRGLFTEGSAFSISLSLLPYHLKGRGDVEEGEGGIEAMDRDLTWDGEQTIQCTDDVLNCAPETCIILLTSVTPISSIKRKKIGSPCLQGVVMVSCLAYVHR